MLQVESPTLVTIESVCQANIQAMANKALQHQVQFRPHFKTHQSAKVATWFKPHGVQAITVSSVFMAQYFAQAGWNDITIAFPLNFRQLDVVKKLAAQHSIGVLIADMEAADLLAQYQGPQLKVWLKLDLGNKRSGFRPEQLSQLLQAAKVIQENPDLQVKGLLYHGGQSYHCRNIVDIQSVFEFTRVTALELKQQLSQSLQIPLLLSCGDTPGCMAAENFEGIDEMRPGVFVYQDLMQAQISVAMPQQFAAYMLCPIVSKDIEAQKLVIYGGAVHFSKDAITLNGQTVYGQVAWLDTHGYIQHMIEGAYLYSLSQEHGLVHLPLEHAQAFQVGGQIAIVPAHICLTVSVGNPAVILNTEHQFESHNHFVG